MPTYRYGLNAILDQITLTSSINSFETAIEASALAADRTLIIPDKDGTIVTTGDTGSVNSNMMKSTVEFQILDSAGGILTTVYGAGE